MIAFDFDDVISDLSSIIRYEIKKKTGVDIINRKEWYVQIPGYTNKDVNDIISDVMFKHSKDMKAIKGSIEVLEKLYKLLGQDIIIVTARWKALQRVTDNWLKKNIGNKFKYNVIYAGRKSKSEVLDPSIKFFVDDKADTVNDLADHLETVFLLSKSWNSNAKLKSNVVRIKSLETVLYFIKRELKK